VSGEPGAAERERHTEGHAAAPGPHSAGSGDCGGGDSAGGGSSAGGGDCAFGGDCHGGEPCARGSGDGGGLTAAEGVPLPVGAEGPRSKGRQKATPPHQGRPPARLSPARLSTRLSEHLTPGAASAGRRKALTRISCVWSLRIALPVNQVTRYSHGPKGPCLAEGLPQFQRQAAKRSRGVPGPREGTSLARPWPQHQDSALAARLAGVLCAIASEKGRRRGADISAAECQRRR